MFKWAKDLVSSGADKAEPFRQVRSTTQTSSIKEPEAWLLRSWGADGGVSVNSDTALSLTTVYACVRILAESIASLPLKLYRKDGGKRIEESNHPLHRLIKEEPNGNQTSFEFREMMQGHLGLRGNCYSRIYRDNYSMPVAVEPWHPGHVRVVQNTDTGRIVYYYRGKAYDPYEVLHVKGLSGDGLVGYNPISILKETFALALSSQKHGLKVYDNNATPGGVLQTQKPLTDAQVERLREEWDRKHKGVSNSGRPAILYGGMEWKSVGLTMRDAQFLESRKFDVEEIARCYRIPLHLLQSTEKSTSWGTGIEQQNIGFIEYTLRPWLVRWEQSLNRILLTEKMKLDGFYFKFNLDALLRGDFKTRMEGYRTGIESGILSINEVREKEDLNPIDGPEGDEHFRPLNTVPADQLGQEVNA